MVKFEHGGQVHRWKDIYPHLLDFSANINPLGLAKSIQNALQNSLGEIVHYPEPFSCTLRAEIAVHYHLPEESIFVGNGAAEILYLLARILRPKRALVTAPTFGEYQRSLHGIGCEVEEVPLKRDFSFSFEEIQKRISQVEIAYFGNPNNPVGKLISINQWEPLLQTAQKSGTFVVVDESFLDFLPAGGVGYSAFPLITSNYPNLLVLRSLTKFYALPGLRLGFCGTSPEMVRQLENNSDGWNVNRLAQIAGSVGLKDVEYQQETRNHLPYWQESMKQELISWGAVDFYEPVVNFILCRLKSSEVSVGELSKEARKQGLLIRDASNFSGLGDQWFRLAIRTSEENKRALEILKNSYQNCLDSSS